MRADVVDPRESEVIPDTRPMTGRNRATGDAQCDCLFVSADALAFAVMLCGTAGAIVAISGCGSCCFRGHARKKAVPARFMTYARAQSWSTLLASGTALQQVERECVLNSRGHACCTSSAQSVA